MILLINLQTNEAFLVQDIKAFERDYQVVLTPKSYNQEEIFDIRATGKFPQTLNWKSYIIPNVSLKFAERMLKSPEPYTLIGRPWLTKSVFQQFQQLQLLLNRIPAYSSNCNTSTHNKVSAVKENSLALVIELVEMLQCLPHKTWRAIDNQSYDETEALEELIDVFFFVFNIGIAMDWTYADLIITMAYKMNKNFDRVRTGYNKID